MVFGMPTLVECKDAAECIEVAKSLSLSFVELNQSFPQYQSARLDVDALKNSGIKFTFHADESANPFDFNDKISAAYTDYFLETVDVAKKLGAKVINMHLLRGVYVTLPEKRIFLNEVYFDAFMQKVRAFGDAMEKALSGSDTYICIENTDGFLPYELAAIEELLKREHFGITLDIGHNACINYADDEFLHRFESRLMHMHLHDAAGKNPHLAFGDGNIDIEKYISLGKKYNASAVIEVKTLSGLETSTNYIYK